MVNLSPCHSGKTILSTVRIPKLIGIVLLCLSFIIKANAQVSTHYTFSYSGSNSYAAPSGTVTTLSSSLATAAVYSGIDLAAGDGATGSFSFVYECNTYTSIGISTNGFIWFGSTNPATTEYTPIASATAYSGIIAAFAEHVTSGTKLSYSTTGAVGSRVFTVAWTDMGPSTGGCDLEIKLTETTNTIQIILYDNPFGLSGSQGAEVGLRGPNNTDFYNFSASGNWCAQTPNTTSNASISTIQATTACKYATSSTGGEIDYIFTPAGACCTAPGIAASSFTSGSYTVNGPNSMATIGFTRGTGNGGVIVVGAEDALPTFAPTTGTVYSGGNAAFGSGTAEGNGYLVYTSTTVGDGVSNVSIPLTVLNTGHSYYFAIYELSTNSGACYQTMALTGNFCIGPPAMASISASPSSICASTTSAPAGSTLSLTGLPATNPYTFQWQSSATSGSGYANASGTSTNATYGTTSTLPYSPNTYYVCQVTCPNNSSTTQSNQVTSTYNSFINCYCVPTMTATSNDGIAAITILQVTPAQTELNTGTLAVPEGGVAYTLNTTALPQFSLGSQYTINVTAGNKTKNYIAAWIDYNQDGTFESATEQIPSSGTNLISNSTASQVSGAISFTVPGTALTGTTMMRLMGIDATGATTTQCPTSGNGEVLDYWVQINAAPCSGTPTPGTVSVTTPASASVCPGSTATLAVSGQTSGVSGITYQWQIFNGSSYVNVTGGSGATSSSYTTPALANATTGNLSNLYQCVIGCTPSGLSAAQASPVTLTIYPTPVITVNSSSAYTASMCALGTPTSVSLSAANGASGTTTYAWSPTAGLSSSSIYNPVATPASTTTYTVTGTANTCTATATAAITVNPNTISITPTTTINTGGSTTLTASSSSTNGAVTYGWNPCSSLTSDTASTVTATPTGSTTYTVTAFDPAGCEVTATTTVNVTNPSVPSSGATTVAAAYTGYTYLDGGATFNSMTGATVLATNSGMTNSNYTINLSSLSPAFNFIFPGGTYNQFGVNTNGFVYLGGTAPSASTNQPIALAGSANGIISGWGVPLQGYSGTSGSGSNLEYVVSGTSPNRTLTIQWTKTQFQTNAGEYFTMQIVLYENGGTNSNQINFIYSDQSSQFVSGQVGNVQIGLRGATNSDYYDLTGSGGGGFGWDPGETSVGSSNSTGISFVGGAAASYISGNDRITYVPGCVTSQTTITPSGTTNLCPGGSVNLTASSGASYAWYINGTLSATTTQTINGVNTAGTYVAVTTSSGGCGVPSYVTAITTNSNVTPSVTIAASVNPFCGATAATFTATPTNGGCVPTYQWYYNGTAVAALAVNATTYANNSLNLNDYVYAVMTSDALCTTANPVTSNTLTNDICGGTYTWTGTTSSNWTVTSNWTPTPPVGGPNSCAADVIIPVTGISPVLGTAVTVGNVQIAAGAQLTLNSNISVCKNWTGGTGSAANILGSGIVVLNGSIAQTISGNTQYDELELSNSQGAALTGSATVGINTALDLNRGNFDASLGSLTFLSTAVNQAGIIDNFSAGNSGTITGSINAQRYYATTVAASYDQHFMGSPVDSPAKSQFGISGTAGFVVPTGNCDETQLAHGSPYGALFSYHESNSSNSGCGMSQWYVETSGDAQNGLGYSVRVAGSGTLTLSGTANLNSSYTLTGLANSNWSNTTLQGHTDNSGWQLVANPYLASLQLTTVNAGFDNQIQVWHANGPFAGTYTSEMLSTSGDTIAPFQAFMVHKTNPGSGGTYTINASERVRTPYEFFIQNDNELDIMVQNIATGLLDNTIVAFNSNATDEFDPQFDADKFGGALYRHTLYTMLADGRWLSRNVMNSINTTATVPMGLEPGATGSYAMVFNSLNTFDATTYIYLEDKQAGVTYNVRNGDYQFTADSSDNWNRFVLHFTPPVSINATSATCVATGMISVVQPGPANWNYTITNSSSVVIASGTLNQSLPIHISAAQGTYMLNLVDNNNYSVTKTIIVVGSPDISAGFSVPASASVQSPVNFISTSQNAVGYTWTFGDGSIITGVANPTYTYAQPGVYTVTLVVTDAEGCTSTTSQTITITGAAGIAGLGDNGAIRMWSNENLVYVDFSKVAKVDAVIKIYNILGQELSNEKFTNNSVYQKEIVNIAAAYVIVNVVNEDQTTTKKLFIINTK